MDEPRKLEELDLTTYSVSAILDAGEVDHAINACKGGTVAAIAMRIKLLLGQDVAALL